MKSAGLALLAGLFALCGCARQSSDSPVRHANGAELRDWTVNPMVATEEQLSPPLRLLSLAPSATEICCALGLEPQLVARTRFCEHPPAIRPRPEIGDLDQTNPEALLELKPDLVFVSGVSRAITERLERIGLKYESLPDSNLADVFRAIERVGVLTGRPRTAAKLRLALERDLEQVVANCAVGPSRRVLILLAPLSDPPAPPFAVGPGSFHDDLLQRAGHVNAIASQGRAYGPLALETVLQVDPDVIIELDADGSDRPGGDADALRAWARLGNLNAVANRRVHVLTGRQHHIPGPRVVAAFAELCHAIAGEAP